MTMTWIVVANARHARIFAHSGPNKTLELVQEDALGADEEPFQEPGGRASPKHKEPERLVARGFAHRVAHKLNHGRSRGDFKRAILVAPPAFMGLLNAELDAPTASLVSDRLDKDYTRSETRELREHLGQCLCV
jgi:protein required for attachment to host cells